MVCDCAGSAAEVARGSACRQPSGVERDIPGVALGRAVGGSTTKIHAVTDEHGLPVQLAITPAQQHDATVAAALLDDLKADQIPLGDKGLRRRLNSCHGP